MKNNLYIQPLSSLDKKEFIILNLKSFIFAYSITLAIFCVLNYLLKFGVTFQIVFFFSLIICVVQIYIKSRLLRTIKTADLELIFTNCGNNTKLVKTIKNIIEINSSITVLELANIHKALYVEIQELLLLKTTDTTFKNIQDQLKELYDNAYYVDMILKVYGVNHTSEELTRNALHIVKQKAVVGVGE